MKEQFWALVNFLHGRKQDYQQTYMSPAGQRVLADLARFCRANETCVVPGDRDRTFVLEGRREVLLRIQEHLRLTPEQLAELYSGKTVTGVATT